MILAAKYARENKVPYLGICLGMQISVIEMCRHVCLLPSPSDTYEPIRIDSHFDYGSHQVLGLGDADSEEFNKDAPDCVVMYMPEVLPFLL